MKYEKSILILMLTIFLFTVSAVNASDINDMLISTENTNQAILSLNDEITDDKLQISEENATLTQVNNDEILGADENTYSQLASEIGSGGNIELQHDYYIYDSGSTINITVANSVIDGKGAVIDMNGAVNMRALNVGASDVTIKNLTIKNANYDFNGGAIYFESSGTVTNCNFINNSASNGGAIFAINGIKFLDSIFENNTANKSGGAVYIEDSFSDSKINSTFINNNAFNGGALYFNADVNNVVINASFKGNVAERAGGAIFVRGQTKGNNFSSEFYNNRGMKASGGAIFFNKLAENNCFESILMDNYALYGASLFFYNKANNNIFNSEFINNTAESCGGAIFFHNTTDKNNFSGCFINNSALGNVDPTNGNGGAITFKDVSTNCMFTCDFINNTAALYGGGVNYRHTPHNITFNSNFINNNASTGGGVNFFESFENVIFNGEFIGNSAINGGALAAGDGIVSDVSFINNHAEKGGAVYFNNSSIVTNCNFTSNKAAGDSSFGGAVFFNSNSSVKYCNFIDNSASGNGGAIYFTNDSEVIYCNFIDNSASGDGGAVYLNTNSTVKNCSFVNNSVTGNYAWGGAVRMYSGNVSNCTFTNNTSYEDGGAIWTYFGNVSNCNFTDNQATDEGGAVYFFDNGDVRNCNFTNNTASENGGAVFFFDNGDVRNCNFTNNEVVDDGSSGGAIYFYGGGNVIDSIFTNNKAAKNGGAIYVESQSINNNFSSQFYDNYAGQSGGAIFFHNLVQNNTFESIFKDNYAGYGAGMFFSRNANANRFNSDFINNTAKSCGGAMFFYSTTDKNNFTGTYINNSALGQIDPTNGNGGAITFKNVSTNSIFTCDFINNTARLYGGAVNYRETPHNITFNANFINNNASTGGGVNFFESFENVIFNGEFIGNSAINGGALAAGDGIVSDVSFADNCAEKGGAVYFSGSGEVSNCIFTNNTATDDFNGGGAIHINSGNVTNSVFTANKATGGAGLGGAIQINSGNVTDCSFENNFAEFGGAVGSEKTVNINNCNFAANTASVEGGALYMSSGNIENSNFTNNNASNDNSDGGAIYINEDAAIINCNFMGNEANIGSAIFFWAVGDSKYTRSIFNSTFLNNKANMDPITPFTLTINETNIEIAFVGNDNLLNAIFSRYNGDVNITNVTYWGANGIENTGNSTIVPVMSYMEAGQNVTIAGVVKGIPINGDVVTNAEGKIVLDAGSGDYWLSVSHDDDSYYSSAKTVFTNMALNVNVTSQTTTNKTVNITAKSNIFSEVMPGKLQFILPNGTQINATYGTNGTWWALHTFDAIGVYQINASYVGLDNVTINNGSISIDKTPTEITVENTTVNLFVLDSVASGAVLTPADAGNLTFNSSNESVAKVENGKIIAIGAGSANITVSFKGNDEYEAAENKTIYVTVSKIATNITVESTSLDLKVGNESAIIATLNPSDAGNLTFTSSDDSIVTVDDKGNVKAVGEGSATITVTYAGDDKYTPSNATVSVNVSKSDVKPEIIQNDTTLTVSVPEDATGNITLTIGNETITAPIENGKAVIDLSDVPAGDYNATVSYPGDDKYSGFEVVASVSIESEFQLIAENLTKYYRGTERFAVKALDGKGNPISGVEVKILLNGMTYTRITDENGSASIGINLESGEYIATVSGNNTTVEATITVLTTVNGTDLVKVFRNATQYYATFRDSEGNYLKEGTTVRFNIHGVFYDRQISGDKGLAKLNINLEQGEYIITAINLETGESRANNITVLPRIVENYDLTKYYRNESQYTVKLIDDVGNPVGAGEEVTFNINGVFYTRTTNESGIAKLNINLQEGDYIITAGYKGCLVSNKIKVLPVLTAQDFIKKYGTNDQFTASLVDGQGKPYLGQKIQFNINGVFYYRTTDSNGQAKLNINLQPGEYIITSSYNGASIGNKVTVTA